MNRYIEWLCFCNACIHFKVTQKAPSIQYQFATRIELVCNFQWSIQIYHKNNCINKPDRTNCNVEASLLTDRSSNLLRFKINKINELNILKFLWPPICKLSRNNRLGWLALIFWHIKLLLCLNCVILISHTPFKLPKGNTISVTLWWDSANKSVLNFDIDVGPPLS